MIEKLKAFWAKVTGDAAELWEKDKIFFIIFGVLIAIAKFRDVLIQLIVGAAKHTVEETEKKSTELQDDQNKANNQANDLIKDAEKKAADANAPVDEDWYKKK